MGHCELRELEEVSQRGNRGNRDTRQSEMCNLNLPVDSQTDKMPFISQCLPGPGMAYLGSLVLVGKTCRID